MLSLEISCNLVFFFFFILNIFPYHGAPGELTVVAFELLNFIQLFVTPMDFGPLDSPVFPGKNTGVGYHFLLQGIFPTQGLMPCLLH